MGTGVVLLVSLLSTLTGSGGSTLPNVASDGTATQSSTGWAGVPSRAIDGNKDPIYTHGSCSCTMWETNPWWRLTLPGVYRVTAVSISKRKYVSERLDNATILIGNSPHNNGTDNPKCAVAPFIPAGQTGTYQCGGMEGRFVNIYLSGPSRILTLCEVEVFAELVGPFHSGMVMGRNVMVVGKKLVWSDALLFCRNAFWDLMSVRSQEEQLELENLLSNVHFPLTKHMWLGLRRYLRGDQWFWMTGESMNYSGLQTASIWQASSPCGGMKTRSPYLWTDYPCDDHAHFICLTEPWDGVDRVEFYSSRNALKTN